jgi:N-acetylglucosamine-6-sulfatase
LTGQYTHHHKVVGNSDPFPKGTKTFPESLQRANYETAFVGKWHMGSSSSAPRAGFDHWVSFRGQGTYSPERQTINVNGKELPRRKYVTDELTDYAVEWLADRDGDKPFLLYLAHKGVHGLYDPAPRHRDRYQDVKVKLPATMAIEQNRDKPLWVQDQRNSWHGVEYPYYGRSKQSLTEMYKHYCEMILSIDDSVGQIMQTLEDNGLDRNTLVVFTSDGGHLWGEHGLIDKRCAYEPSMRIPLIIHGADRFPKGEKIEALVANIRSPRKSMARACHRWRVAVAGGAAYSTNTIGSLSFRKRRQLSRCATSNSSSSSTTVFGTPMNCTISSTTLRKLAISLTPAINRSG